MGPQGNILEIAHHNPDFESTWIGHPGDRIPHIPLNVSIPGRKRERILADPAPRLGIIPASAIVLQIRIGVEFAAGEEVTGFGGVAAGHVAVGIIHVVYGDRAVLLSQVADRAQVFAGPLGTVGSSQQYLWHLIDSQP